MQPSEAERVYSKLKASAFDEISSQEEVAHALGVLAASWLRTLTGVAMEGQLGAPDWRGYELRLWELGEVLRHLLKTKRWRGKGPLLDEVAGLLGQRAFGKGRQTLATVLGDFGGREYGKPLGEAAEDPAVWGHALKALTKARIGGQRARAERVAAEGEGWARRAAQRYLKELGDAGGERDVADS